MFENCQEDDGEPVEFTINKKYAEFYDKWREKEELQKLKDRYGNDVDQVDDENETSETDESEDLDSEDLNPEVEKNFLSVLSALKSKDSSIYDKNFRYFPADHDESSSESGKTGSETGLSECETGSSKVKNRDDEKVARKKSMKKNTEREKPLFLKDYERKVVLEKGGELPDEIDQNIAKNSEFDDLSYADQQNQLKKNFKMEIDGNDEEFLVPRKKTEQEEKKEEADYLEWLKGKKSEIHEKDAEKKLKYLHDYWNDPKLEKGEKFLKNYILNKCYLGDDSEEQGETSKIPTYDEIVGTSSRSNVKYANEADGDPEDFDEEEKLLEAQEQFEHKYNFRFEEPDEEFIKSYPRTIQGSLRRKDDKNKRSREAKKERQQKLKEQKREELKRLKNLKRKEIQEKLKKLKQITGNHDLPLDPDEFERDFDPAEYDRKMKEMFDDNYYAQVDENEEKPQFSSDSGSDDDEEEHLENWAPKSSYSDSAPNKNESSSSYLDSEPNKTEKDRSPSSSKKKRKSKFMQAVNRPKPLFDSTEKTFEQYFDEYYKLDCEDIVGHGDIVCRFKYRKVPPNDFGLTTEEILRANPKELNSWVTVKKMSQYRPEKDEVYDIHAYQKKASDFNRKRKILTSVYGDDDNNDQDTTISCTNNNDIPKNEPKTEDVDTTANSSSGQKKKRKRNRNKQNGNNDIPKIDNKDNVVANNDNNFQGNKKKRRRKNCASNFDNNNNNQQQQFCSTDKDNVDSRTSSDRDNVDKNKKRSTIAAKSRDRFLTRLPDERLKSYGINPKKFKNKLKYGPSKKS